MKALYLGFNRSYTNATAELTLRVIGAIAQLDYFGPGFSCPKQLSLGIAAWCDKHGPYDFVITDSYVFECENLLSRDKPFLGDHVRFTMQDFVQHARHYQQFFLRHSGTKILIANWDTYGIASSMVQRLVESNAFVIEPGISVHRPLADISQQYGEPVEGNDNWYNFVKDFRERIIAVPHFVATTEFDFSPLAKRKEAFVVIGAPYPERKRAMQLQTMSRKVGDFFDRFKVWLRFKYINSMTEPQLNSLRLSYLATISNAKMSYCSGGPWLFPVRKYFEIPCRGSVAIGQACNGFVDLGFVDKVNFLVAHSNVELAEIICDSTDDVLEAIAARGRALVWNTHSDWARIKQMRQSLQLLVEQRFKGSYWRNGEYRHYPA